MVKRAYHADEFPELEIALFTILNDNKFTLPNGDALDDSIKRMIFSPETEYELALMHDEKEYRLNVDYLSGEITLHALGRTKSMGAQMTISGEPLVTIHNGKIIHLHGLGEKIAGSLDDHHGLILDYIKGAFRDELAEFMWLSIRNKSKDDGEGLIRERTIAGLHGRYQSCSYRFEALSYAIADEMGNFLQDPKACTSPLIDSDTREQISFFMDNPDELVAFAYSLDALFIRRVSARFTQLTIAYGLFLEDKETYKSELLKCVQNIRDIATSDISPYNILKRYADSWYQLNPESEYANRILTEVITDLEKLDNKIIRFCDKIEIEGLSENIQEYIETEYKPILAEADRAYNHILQNHLILLKTLPGWREICFAYMDKHSTNPYLNDEMAHSKPDEPYFKCAKVIAKAAMS